MSVIDTLLSDIDAAVRGSGERRRHALLRRTAATMIDRMPDLSDHQLAVFDDVLVSLAGEVEAETRAELSDKLADLPRLPKRTARALALDPVIRVAKPLIERSACLDDDTLLAIITEKESAFLNLVARRRALPPHLLDSLIVRADDTLLIEIARNEATGLSDRALRLLAERALSYQPLYRILRTRPDLAMRHVGAMIEAARYRAKSESPRHDLDEDSLSRALAAETAAKIAQATHLSLSAPAPSFSAENMDDLDINDMLALDRIDEALSAVAFKAGLTHDSVKRAFHAPQHEPLMFLLRAQDYPLATVMNFMRQKHGTISGEFEAQLGEAYCALARDTAKRIAAFMAEKQDLSASSPDKSESLRQSA